ncbi:MAG: TetR/AcrR family transcriptional regulator, partial [Candidatus Neomarinimicrobiota bacterium]
MKISSVSSKKKIDKIVETGKKLFYRYGIKKVSVEEICKEAGVSKATFYK